MSSNVDTRPKEVRLELATAMERSVMAYRNGNFGKALVFACWAKAGHSRRHEEITNGKL